MILIFALSVLNQLTRIEHCGVYLLIADIIPNHGLCWALRSMLAMDSRSEIASLLNADSPLHG